MLRTLLTPCALSLFALYLNTSLLLSISLVFLSLSLDFFTPLFFCDTSLSSSLSLSLVYLIPFVPPPSHHQNAGNELLPLKKLWDGSARPSLERVVDHQPVSLGNHEPRCGELLPATVSVDLNTNSQDSESKKNEKKKNDKKAVVESNRIRCGGDGWNSVVSRRVWLLDRIEFGRVIYQVSILIGLHSCIGLT